MKATIYFARSVTDAVDIEVKDLNELKELAKDRTKLHKEIDRQDKNFEEVNGEVLCVEYYVQELDKTFTEDELTEEV